MIQSSLAFARAQTGIPNLNANRILVSGGTANLRGLPDYLQSAFDCPVERFEPDSGLDVASLSPEETASFESDPGRYAVALGLAVSGAKEEAFLVDLIPEPVKKKRHFTTRTIFSWISAAAAILVLVLHYMDLSAAKDDSVAAKRRAQGAANSAKRRYGKFVDLQNDINKANREIEELVDLTRPGWAFCRSLALLQAHAPADTWIENIDVVQKLLPIDPDDPKSKKENRFLVEVRGVMLSAKSKAEGALNEFSRSIQKSSGDQVSADLTSVHTRDVPGSKQVDFIMTLDVYHGERQAGKEPVAGEEAN